MLSRRTFCDKWREELETLVGASLDGGPAAALEAPSKPAHLAIPRSTPSWSSIAPRPAWTTHASAGGGSRAVRPFGRDASANLAGHSSRDGGASRQGAVRGSPSPRVPPRSSGDGHAGDVLLSSDGGGGGIPSFYAAGSFAGDSARLLVRHSRTLVLQRLFVGVEVGCYNTLERYFWALSVQ